MKNNQQNDFSKLFELLSGSDQQAKKEAANSMISNLNQEDNNKLTEILNDRSKIDSILNSPAAKQILNKIKSNDNGQHK